MILLQTLGIIIPTICILVLGNISSKEEWGNNLVPIWVFVLFVLSLVIFGFTLGTIVMS